MRPQEHAPTAPEDGCPANGQQTPVALKSLQQQHVHHPAEVIGLEEHPNAWEVIGMLSIMILWQTAQPAHWVPGMKSCG